MQQLRARSGIHLCRYIFECMYTRDARVRRIERCVGVSHFFGAAAHRVALTSISLELRKRIRT